MATASEERPPSPPGLRVRLADICWLMIVVALVCWQMVHYGQERAKLEAFEDFRTEAIDDLLERVADGFQQYRKDLVNLQERQVTLYKQMERLHQQIAQNELLADRFARSVGTLALAIDEHAGGESVTAIEDLIELSAEPEGDP